MNSATSEPITKICVIGAGVMGAGIAAQAANAGCQVVLLDVVEGAAQSAISKMLKTQPAPFMHPKFAKRITPGTLDDIRLVEDCDWIIEAVIERLDIKQKLYGQIAPHMKPGAVLSSNTSTLPLEVLIDGMAAELRPYFLITHFFNPPRYMRLLEIVTGPYTDPDVSQRISEFSDHALGKSIVFCHDTPGFIANRIGTYWLHCAVSEAIKMGIGIEQADAVLGRPMGVPKTGVFALLDLVGLDLMPHVLDSIKTALAKEDAFHALGPAPPLLAKMIEDGYTGRKGKGGFYRLNTEGGQKIKEAIDLTTGEYAPARRPKIDAALAAKKDGLRATVEHDSLEGRYAWSVISKTLVYAATLASQIADDIEAVDRAMRLGYNWKWGPFELLDKLGTRWFERKLKSDGQDVPELLLVTTGRPFYKTVDGQLHHLSFEGHYRPVHRAPGVLLLQDIKRKNLPMAHNSSASVWDIGDGVACLEFHSKMNSLNPFVLSMMNWARKELPKRAFKGLVIYNEGTNFSVGANIAMLMITAKLRLWPIIRWILRHGQNTFDKLKTAPFPVVGAPHGMALGGGCEVLLHCDAIQAHAETYTGLIEAGVGIVPGWGGCKELLTRWSQSNHRPGGPMPPVMKSFEAIATAQVSKSAFEAQDLMILRPHDGVVMNQDRVLAQAKAQVLELADGYRPPPPIDMHLPGPTGRAALELAVRDFVQKGVASPHDAIIAKQLARVLSGGDTDMLDTVSEADVLKLERDAIIELAKTPKTRARVEHMLKTGKPLRN
ncbi:MAG: 3-hydroxyacyl-CoA dehydrogenase [Magnetovibrio sp.]|nr:3-hydroxyacyl-CoA dehydrogenase [Magnetovibrio sp.]